MIKIKFPKIFFITRFLKKTAKITLSFLMRKNIGLIIFFLLVFFLVFRPSVDPDLGWHLRAGELILERGVPKTDWFSYTMPDYPWIDHEWLSDIIAYLIFSKTGFLGLSIFFSLIVLLAFILLYFTLPSFLSREIKMLLIFAGIFTSMPVISGGARMQYLTLLGITFLLYLFLKWRHGKLKTKKLFILPFIFVLWVNLHGGFIFGLALFFLFVFLEWLYLFFNKVGFKFFESRHSLSIKDFKKATICFFVSLLATFANPYLYRIYIEIYHTFTSKEAFNNIAEFVSPNFHSQNFLLFLGFFIATAFILALSKKRPDFTLGILSLFFLIMSFRSVRHIPIFVIINTFFIASHLDSFSFPESIKKRFNHAAAIFFLFLTALLLIIAPFRTYETIKASFSKGMYSVSSGYPTLLVQYLREHPLSGNVFNVYGWGGYLIYEKAVDRVFVDGRMAIWKKDGRCAFCDYLSIARVAPGWKEKLDSYKVDWVIVERGGALDGVLREINTWKFYAGDRYGVVYKREKNE